MEKAHVAASAVVHFVVCVAAPNFWAFLHSFVRCRPKFWAFLRSFTRRLLKTWISVGDRITRLFPWMEIAQFPQQAQLIQHAQFPQQAQFSQQRH